MKRVLAIDTTSPWGGVALVQVEDGQDAQPDVVAESGFQARDHARHVLGWMDAVLEHAGVAKDAIDLFVGTRGPGSFTGLRIGLGTVQGLAVATGKPCIGVGTLDAMAAAFGPAESIRIPMLFAGRKEVYGASFSPTSMPPQQVRAPLVGSPKMLLEELAGEAPAVVFGSGVELIDEPRPGNVRVGVRPRSVAAAAACLALGLHGSGVPEDSMTPLYVRPPDATPPR